VKPRRIAGALGGEKRVKRNEGKKIFQKKYFLSLSFVLLLFSI
jgi:hypothetical protein